MKYNKICCFLVLSFVLGLLVSVLAIPTHAAGGTIRLSPSEGKIGDWIEINGYGFEANETVRIYFSSNKASEGDSIGSKVTAYAKVTTVSTDAGGRFSYTFTVPEALIDGRKEDVHGGDYYFYATYPPDKEIIAVAIFTVIDGEIELDPGEGTVGSEVKISGEGLRSNQKIIVECDGDKVDITSGDSETDSDGKFTCTIIIPESAIGSHIITVTDESGNKPEAEFEVKPKVSVVPSQQAVGGVVTVSGTGFGKKEVITLTFDGDRIETTPAFIQTNSRGSFGCQFAVPFHDSCGIRKVEASDTSFNRAEAQLTVLAGITLSPVTSPASPGHVGMELIVRGFGFIPNATVTITYGNNDQGVPVAKVTTDVSGNFSADFTVPPSTVGSRAVTVTDGTTTVTATLIMESQAPPIPMPLLPQIAGTVGAEAYFDWEDVTDPSGVSYNLQVASDADFIAVVLEKKGLPHSEYTLTKEERLESAKKQAYYWRVKAVDGAGNEGEWAPPVLFYVGFSWASMPNWFWYILYGLGALLLGILGFWVRKIRE